MLSSWQEKWLVEHFRSYGWGAIDNELFLDRDLMPLEEAVLCSWKNVDIIYLNGKDHPTYMRCNCGERMLKGCFLADHDCWCIECQEVKVPVITYTPELSAADEILYCPRCGERGSHRSINKTPA